MKAARLLTADDVVEILGVSTTTLAKWRLTGDPVLPYLRLNGRIRYRACDVEEFLDHKEADEDEDSEDERDGDGDEEDDESD